MKSPRILLSSVMLTAALSVTSVAQADGFFSKLLGAKDGAGFSSLLSHVPADTAFLFANEKPIPDEVISFHLKRSQEVISMISNMDLEGKEPEKNSPESFFKALMENLGNKLSKGKLEETGLSLKATSMIYGFEMTPVIRLTFADKEKIMETIKQAEKESGYKVELSKCGDYDCFLPPNANDDQSIAIVLLKGHIAASIFTAESKEKVMDHLTGKSTPKEAYPLDKWGNFLKDNNYTGYGDGYIDLQRVYNSNKPLIAAGIQKDAKGKMDEKELENCMAVAEDHFKNVPEIVFGTKNLETQKMDYELVVKTSSGVSTILQTIANKTNIAQRLDNPIFDIGFNIDFVKMRDGLTEYSNFLIKSGETHKCKNIDAKEIRKGMGGMMMAMNMGLTQLKSIYGGFNDIDLDEKSMSPKNVDAYISIGTDDPAGLFGMVSMMSPPLMGFQIPADGKAVKLPDGAIPAKGMPVPPIYLSRSAKSLNIMVGNKEPKLIDYSSKTPEIMSFGMDGKRYYEKLTSVMKVLPDSNVTVKSSTGDKDDAIKMMETVGKLMGKYQQEVTADKRGLVVNYHVTY